ncbi:SDR family NAD(P)-dependent oxidoreductase [Dactylosporangium vinaceum]|uniref:SDR family NAD(P)-dependent oxidoreductase n=1 Tax=Dactylosporangium vinaceum TaxID=53362 RepID=A0ABV5MHC6_9ACTN|nr:SDR family oxidoreductase [Dactylosporangium vinaceum]UAB94831.1 SDR family NAD(P)-dependent oxidoreductase [Dactylosporangium vinaceum]
MPPDPNDVEACLRVLAAIDDADERVVAAVDRAYKARKKVRKAERRAAASEHDRRVLDGPGDTPLIRARRCYVCKSPYREVPAGYPRMCAACAGDNTVRRHARCDLTGRRALVTGGRIKIGFETALKLLRDGADVVVSTRFPGDAARRYDALPDAGQWRHRLRIHGVDFLDPAGAVGLADAVAAGGHLDILVNNAAQTIQRPASYYRELAAAEGRPELPASPADLFFPPGALDETGEPLDLRPVNSWTLKVHQVTPREWLEVQVINAFVPFLLTARLREALRASPFPDRYIVNVSAMEGSFSRANKTADHPHTNMAKAGLNMLTRTIAGDYAADGIHVTSVDTGWVTDERPHATREALHGKGFRVPLDVVDGAARVYDPIVRGVHGDRVHGVFLKDYRVVQW